MLGINANRFLELHRDFPQILRVLSESPGIDKDLAVPPEEFARRQSATWQALESASLDAGFVFSDEHYCGDVPYLGGNSNVSIEQVAGVIGKTGFHIIAGLEGGYIAEQLAPRARAIVHKAEMLKLADEQYPIEAALIEFLERVYGKENVVDQQIVYYKIKYEKSDNEMRLIRDANKVADAMMRAMLAVLR